MIGPLSKSKTVRNSNYWIQFENNGWNWRKDLINCHEQQEQSDNTDYKTSKIIYCALRRLKTEIKTDQVSEDHFPVQSGKKKRK